MSADREARAMAACETIEVNGKEYRLRPVTVQHLCDLEREALKHYKRQYLSTFMDNVDLLEPSKRDAMVEKKMEEVARWDLNDLPKKDAYDASRLPITDKLKQWVIQSYDDSQLPTTEVGFRALILAALDEGRISSDTIKELTGKVPIHGRIRYDQWWVTATITGMVSFIVSSIRIEHPEVTKEKIQEWSFAKTAEAARIVESITSASLGNTSA